ncbi:MAG: phosphate transporter inner rane subunit PstA [Ilumatobacteraceae bacterium]|nr:phosphate transporter inner rane subunit PstA [Ilumatobacteraceae bacterium]
MAVATLAGSRSRESLAAELAGVSGRRRNKNIVMTVLMGLAVAVVGFVLVLILITVLTKGWSIVSGAFPQWFTKDIQLSPRRPGPGMKAAIIGTAMITLTATVIAVPLGIAGAVYLNEYGKNSPLAKVLRFLTNVMAGVPSIVMGLFIYVFWVVPKGVNGLNGLSGALALACLMLPIIVRSCEEMLRLVPQNLREASYALGASESRTTLAVVLPKAAPGVISGCLLAIARAAGETAPLIFTIGASKATNWNPFKGTNTTLSYQIYGNAKQSFATAQERAWGAALTLIVLAFAFTFAARILTARLSRNR